MKVNRFGFTDGLWALQSGVYRGHEHWLDGPVVSKAGMSEDHEALLISSEEHVWGSPSV